VPYISLVNLILDRQSVKELIQNDLNTEAVVSELNQLLSNEERIRKIQTDYSELWDKLGSGGASERAARLIVGDL
jgi:lipid-A-disaccharide synthase